MSKSSFFNACEKLKRSGPKGVSHRTDTADDVADRASCAHDICTGSCYVVDIVKVADIIEHAAPQAQFFGQTQREIGFEAGDPVVVAADRIILTI